MQQNWSQLTREQKREQRMKNWLQGALSWGCQGIWGLLTGFRPGEFLSASESLPIS
jgi:hypothetical protein